MGVLYHGRGGMSSGCTKNFQLIFGRNLLSTQDLGARPRPRKKISSEKQKKVAPLSDLTQTADSRPRSNSRPHQIGLSLSRSFSHLCGCSGVCPRQGSVVWWRWRDSNPRPNSSRLGLTSRTTETPPKGGLNLTALRFYCSPLHR